MDIDLGPVFLAIFVLYGTTFLIGFGIFFIAMTLLTRTWRRSHPNYRYLTVTVIAGVSILGGMLNLNLLNQWDQQEKAKFVKQRQAFIEHLEQEYQILDLQYQDEQEKPFTLVFTVPYDGKYWLTIIGYIADDSYHGFNSMEYANRVVYIIEPHTLTKGTQEYTFGFNAGINKGGIQALDFEINIVPEAPHETLVNTQKGVAVTNAGYVELYDGIIYYSPKLVVTSCSSLKGVVHCTKLDSLRFALVP